MLDFYFKVVFTDGSADKYLRVIAPTAMLAWDILDKELKILGWDMVNYGKTVMITPVCFQNENGKFFENFSKNA